MASALRASEQVSPTSSPTSPEKASPIKRRFHFLLSVRKGSTTTIVVVIGSRGDEDAKAHPKRPLCLPPRASHPIAAVLLSLRRSSKISSEFLTAPLRRASWRKKDWILKLRLHDLFFINLRHRFAED